MARRIRPSKEHRARHRAAAERTARRDSLLVLLSRIQRAVPVTPTEGNLLRAHVEVELTDADTARAALGRQEAQHRQQLAAAHAAIREAEQDAADLREQLRAYRAVEEHRARIIAAGTISAACCVCGHGPVTYRNYREQPFCAPCADGQPAPTTSPPEPQP
ncbi:hypothetical protein [Streptomyces sp. NPDC006267]|uniref:hypothetical protein n=1 Tax=Streptomyces sp. NPDC006267 TaxID=3157173 RepID=UPI0033BB1FF8